MAIAVILLVISCCAAEAAGAAHKHHMNKYNKEVCSTQAEQLRDQIMEKSKCGEPKDVFVDLKLQVSYLQVTPSMVWVKRCVGLCDTESKCVATKTKMEPVPVRIYNSKIEKETCATIEVEVHESCGCCSTTANDCAAPKVYNLRKCSCTCPNMEERRSCLKKRNMNMKWNRSKCTCEVKKRAPW